MNQSFFKNIEPIKYEGPESDSNLAFRHYNPDEIVLGKRLEEHLRFAVAYWHSFAWEGGDPFGGLTFGFSLEDTLVTAVWPNAVSISLITSVFLSNSSSKRLIN